MVVLPVSAKSATARRSPWTAARPNDFPPRRVTRTVTRSSARARRRPSSMSGKAGLFLAVKAETGSVGLVSLIPSVRSSSRISGAVRCWRSLASWAVMGDSGMDDSLSATARLAVARLRADGVRRYLPQPAGRLGVKSMGSDAAARARLVRQGFVAVLEVLAADAVEQRSDRQQHGGGGALLWRLPAGRRTAGRGAHAVELGVADIALQAGADRAGHQRVDGDAVIGPAPGAFHRQQDVGRLGL